jgi:hypothetical protein
MQDRRFLLQINLSEVPALPAPLPQAGLLCIDMKRSAPSWRWFGVRFYPELLEALAVVPTSVVRCVGNYEAAIHFIPGVSYSPDDWAWVFADQDDELRDAWSDCQSEIDNTTGGKADLVELFLAAGMPVDTPNGTGDHAFGMAVQFGFIDVADELLKAGADPKIADRNGTTPLMALASYCDETALFSAILAKGVDVNARARGGQTALKEATDHDCKELVRLLKKKGATR